MQSKADMEPNRKGTKPNHKQKVEREYTRNQKAQCGPEKSFVRWKKGFPEEYSFP